MGGAGPSLSLLGVRFRGEAVELGLCLLLMRLGGLWDGERWPRWLRRLFALYTLWVLGLAVFCTATVLGATVLSEGLLEFSSNMGLLAEVLMSCLKIAVLVANRPRIRRLFARMGALGRGSAAARAGPPARLLLAAAGRRSFAVTAVFMSTGFLTVNLWFLYPVFSGTGLACWAAAAAANATAEPCPEPLLPADAWFPFDVRSNPSYGLAYASQVLGIFYLYLTNCIADTFFVSVMMYVTALLRLLAQDLAALRPAAGPEGRAAADSHLREWVRQHTELMSCAREFQDIINIPVSVQFMCCMLVICMSLFATAGATDAPAMAKVGIYMGQIFAQLLLYCWFGDEVIQQGEAVAAAAFSCRWYDGEAGLQRGVLLTLARVQQRPLVFRAGFFYELSRANYLSMVQACYSAFNVMRGSAQ